MMDSAKKATWVVGCLVVIMAAMLGLAYAVDHCNPWVVVLICIMLLWTVAFGAIHFTKDKDIHI